MSLEQVVWFFTISAARKIRAFFLTNVQDRNFSCLDEVNETVENYYHKRKLVSALFMKN